MRWQAVVPAVLVLLATGCDVNPFDGPNTVAEYDLVSIDGEPLPTASIVDQSNQPQVVIVTSRLLLRPNGRGEERSRERFPPSPQVGTIEVDSEFGYQIDGNQFRVTYDCPDLASCIAGPHLIGRLSDDGIVVEVALGRTPRVYRRR